MFRAFDCNKSTVPIWKEFSVNFMLIINFSNISMLFRALFMKNSYDPAYS